jgi:hypothetical protein
LYERLLQESSDQARKSKIYFSPLFFYVGSGIRIRDPGWQEWSDPGSGSGIRDKHPGSATLLICLFMGSLLYWYRTDHNFETADL